MSALRGASIRWAAIAVTVVCAACASPAEAASTYTVTGTSDATGSCSSTSCTSLRAALAAAQTDPGSTIQLGAGTYTLGNGVNQPVGTGDLETGADVTITGAGEASTIIKQTDGEHRVLYDWSGAATLTVNDLTITGGHLGPSTFADGAGILSNGPLALHHVTVSGNTAVGSTPANQVNGCCEAIAAMVTLGTLVLDHSSVVDNTATGGNGTSVGGGTAGEGGEAIGGILATQFQQVTITDSTISRNIANSGNGGTSTSGTGGQGGLAYGGIFSIDGAPVTITDSTLADNQANAGDGGQGATGGTGGGAYGAGIFVPNAALHISGSTFSGNIAAAGTGGPGTSGAGGGGGQAEGAAVAGGSRGAGSNWIRNSTITANTATGGAPGSGPGGTGMAAYALGGGVAEDTTVAMTIIDSTLAGNTAKGTAQSYGGNLYANPTRMTFAGTIFSDGSAQNGSNCALPSGANATDDGNNLESTTPSQCGLTASSDVIGSGPLLEKLADNGGPTETMALSANSPAIGAGGSCLDFTQSGNPPLTVDQRGKPRKSPCDIGAFETQPPGSDGGGGGGGGNGGGGNGGGNGTGKNGGAAGGGSSLTISRLRQSHARWQEGSALAKLASPSATTARSRTTPTGTVFHFTLSAAATVKVRFFRLLPGRRLKGRCVKSHARHLAKCLRHVASGPLTVAGARSGANTLHFAGRLSRHKRLRPGRYLATFTAANSAGHSNAVSLRFTIVRR